MVASRGPLEASVRTESLVGEAPPERYAMRLAQDEGRWNIVRRVPLEGPIDAPVGPTRWCSPIAIREVPHGHGNMSVAPSSGAASDPPPMLVPGQGAPHGSAPSDDPEATR